MSFALVVLEFFLFWSSTVRCRQKIVLSFVDKFDTIAGYVHKIELTTSHRLKLLLMSQRSSLDAQNVLESGKLQFAGFAIDTVRRCFKLWCSVKIAIICLWQSWCVRKRCLVVVH